MAQTTLKVAWERIQVLAYPRFLRTAFENLNTMLTELYPRNLAVTATTGGGTTGLITTGYNFVTVTSDSADKQISLPAGVIGQSIDILIGATGCELFSVVAADKVNEVTVGATNELALTAEALYTCKYTKSGFWIVTGETKLGARIAALVPDALV